MCDSGVPLWGEFDPAKGDEILEKARPYLDRVAELGNTPTCPLPPKWNEELPLEVSWGTSIEWTRKYAALLAERRMNAAKYGIPPVGIIELYIPGHDKPNYDEEIKISLEWLAENLPQLTLS